MLHLMPDNVNLHFEAKLWIEAMHTQLPRGVAPVIVGEDTMARTFVGDDENRPLDQGKVVEGCKAVRKGLKTAVLVIHHHGKCDESERGGESLRNAPYAVLQTTKARPAQLICDRMKELQEPDPAIMHTDRVETPTLAPDLSDSTNVSGVLVVKLVISPESSAVLKTPANDETRQPLTKPDHRESDPRTLEIVGPTALRGRNSPASRRQT